MAEGLSLDGVERSEIEVSRAEIEASTDEAQLSAWFLAIGDKLDEIASFAAGYDVTGHDDPDWRRRAGGKFGYLKLTSRWVERRILVLGLIPPYHPTDPRAREIRGLVKRVAELERELAGARRVVAPA